MIIHIDELTKLLIESGLPQQGVPPDEHLWIKFNPDTTKGGESKLLDRNDQGSILLDFDTDGNVVGMELDNIPLNHKWRTGPGGRYVDPTCGQ